MKKLKVALLFLAIIWSVFVIVGYFFDINHDQARSSGFSFVHRPTHEYYFGPIKTSLISKGLTTHHLIVNPIIYVVAAVLCLYALLVVYLKHYGKKKLIINAPPVAYFGLFTLLFFLIYFSLVSYYRAGSEINLLIFFRNYIFRSLEIGALFLVISSLGKTIFELIFKKSGSDNLFIFSFGLGAICITFLTFFLGVFGQINQIAMSIIFGLVVIFNIKNIIYWGKQFFAKPMKASAELFDLKIVLILFAAVYLCVNLLMLCRPIPNGNDELELYMNTTNLLASQGKLFGGMLSYPWELLVASVLAISKSLNLAMIFSSISASMVSMVIYSNTRSYCIRRKIDPSFYPLLSAALFFTLPAVVFQLSSDIKVDLPAMFFAGLSLLSFFSWQKNPENRRWLFFSAFLAGFAFSIKPTTVLFSAGLILCLIFELIRIKMSTIKITVLGAMCAVFFLAPFFCFALKNTVDVTLHPRSYAGLKSALFEGYAGEPIIELTQSEKEVITEKASIFKANSESEHQRYNGYEKGISKYLLSPIWVTFNSHVSGYYVDIGFVFLLFVPLAYFAALVADKKSKNIRIFYYFLAASFICWVLWASFCEGIIWYGFCGFLFVLILIVELAHQLKLISKILWLAAVVVMLFWLSINFLQRSALVPYIFVTKNNLLYASGSLSNSKYLNTTISFSGITNFLNDEIAAQPDNPPRIYHVGSMLKFFIKDNNKTVQQDNALSTYIGISEGKTGPEVLDRLKQDGTTYIIIQEKGVSFFGESAEILHSKLEELETTLRSNPDKAKILMDEGLGKNILFVKIL